jgi:hypothetical protein
VKKIITAIAIFLGTSSVAFAEVGMAVGLSATGGLFEASGSERITGTATGGSYHENDINDYAFQPGKSDTSTKTNKKSREDMFVGYGSAFAEVWFDDRFRLGVELMPSDLESDTTENQRHDLCSHNQDVTNALCTVSTNTVKVEITDMATLYGAFHHESGLYFRAGYITAKLNTLEKLETGSSYGNTNLYGVVAGAGYEKDLNNGLFIRGEVSQTEIEGVALYNTGSNNENHISVDGISGMSGAFSIGKSF